jgi:hypothetical protein
MTRTVLVAIVVASALVGAPAFAQQPQPGVTGALGTGTTPPSLGGTASPPLDSGTLGSTPSTGSFGSPSGPTLGTLGGFGSTTPGASVPPSTTSPPPSTGLGTTPNPATGITGPSR